MKKKKNAKKSQKIIKKDKIEISTSKKVLFSGIFILLIFFVLISIEIGLKIANYGINTDIFVKSKYLNEYYLTNPYFINKYHPFASNVVSEPLRNMFLVKKTKDTLRGFVIGGSTAEGFPYFSNHSFGKISEMALKNSGKNVEIINLGFSAMSSYYVADVATKILKYKPDFLIIYAGHNEYYGTISETTGGNYFQKKMYLFLKEFKIVQLIINIINPHKSKEYKDKNLMEIRFNDKKIVKNQQNDTKIANNFINNIDSVVNSYNSKKIPVIIIEPVSNLYDMPPFAGENDKDYKGFIDTYFKESISMDKGRVEDALAERNRNQLLSVNANVTYIDAMNKFIVNQSPNIYDFILAKDLDAIPFRARTVLINKLGEYCKNNSTKYKNLHFIPLQEALISKYGDKVFNNGIFIDHLHFNIAGQIIVSEILSQKIGEIYTLNDEEKSKLKNFYLDTENVKKSIHYLPFYDVSVGSGMENLIKNKPFSSMIIPFRNRFYNMNEITENRNLFDLITTNEDNAFGKMLEYYYFVMFDKQKVFDYIKSYEFVNPANYTSYVDYADFYKIEKNLTDAENYYIKAYLLSGKKKEVYDKIIELFKDNTDKMKEFNKKYGLPKK
ncbi:MAG: hypothetical protein A2Z98_09335 [Spirochaetes bacterium GWB1_27_13]|nr:MAG: hypothetical protein A2Z98_09335 [Spirochaetes bacterium GWB1_27_13]